MIELYTAATSNGQRAAIALEEASLPYEAHVLNLQAGDQGSADYRAINPFGQIPAIVDRDERTGKTIILAQSAAILLYAAKKSGKLLAQSEEGKLEAVQWLLQAVTDCAPANLGIYLCSSAGPAPTEEGSELFKRRLLKYLAVWNEQLASREYICGEYSVADIALYPVVAVRAPLIADQSAYAHLNRWLAQVAARPAVQRGVQACSPRAECLLNPGSHDLAPMRAIPRRCHQYQRTSRGGIDDTSNLAGRATGLGKWPPGL